SGRPPCSAESRRQPWPSWRSRRGAGCDAGSVCSVIVETATEAGAGHGIGTGMTRARKLANLAGTVLPLVGLVVAITLLWNRMVGPRELVILFVGYVLAG